MNTFRLLLASLLAGVGLVVLGPSPAMACSCVEADTRAHVRWADTVFEATVTDIDDPPLRGIVSSGDPRTYHVDVETVFAGEPDDEVRSAMSGASCGLEGLAEGERYVFFADATKDGQWASLCGGTAPATDRLVRDVEAVTGPGTTPSDETSPSPDPSPGGNLAGDDPPAQSAVPLLVWLPPAVGLAAVAAIVVAWRLRRTGTG